MTKIYVFPGQGSQSTGMGANLFDRYPKLTAQASDLLGYDIQALCLQNPDNALNQTNFTQPALYVVNAFTYLQQLEEHGQADYLAGHSLGEYSALMAANVFDFITGLQLVKKRGELMQQVTNGGMAAVVGINSAIIIEEMHGVENLDIANYNSPTQTVISGNKEAITNITAKLEQRGARVIPLKVSGAFHSRFMGKIAAEFGEFLNSFNFNEPKMPVIANINAQPYAPGSVPVNLTMQIDHSVQWVKTVQFLMKQADPTFTEIGPGKVLSGLIRQMRN